VDAQQADAEWQRHRALVQENRAALKRAESELGTAKKRLSDTRIVAPMDGQVLSFKILEGQTVVAAQTAQVIMVLADMSCVTVFAQVSEADISRVRAGQSAYFSTLAEPGRRIDSSIREVEPNATLRANDTSRAIYYNALLNADNQHGQLRAHMTADVTIVETGVKDVLSVPTSAVLPTPVNGEPQGERHADLRDDRRGYLFTHVDGRLRALPVSLGVRDDTRVSVRSGIREGTKVVRDVKALGFADADPRLLALLREADAGQVDAGRVDAGQGAEPGAAVGTDRDLASLPDTDAR
jgi:macrolide-specific efflux system membrane fusion protein